MNVKKYICQELQSFARLIETRSTIVQRDEKERRNIIGRVQGTVVGKSWNSPSQQIQVSSRRCSTFRNGFSRNTQRVHTFPSIPTRAYFNINNCQANFPRRTAVISGRRDGDASVCERDPGCPPLEERDSFRFFFNFFPCSYTRLSVQPATLPPNSSVSLRLRMPARSLRISNYLTALRSSFSVPSILPGTVGIIPDCRIPRRTVRSGVLARLRFELKCSIEYRRMPKFRVAWQRLTAH